MMRRAAIPTLTKAMYLSATTTAVRHNADYNFAMFKNPVRKPQLTEAEREKVVIDQSTWPEEFKDYDPEDPYKKSPEFIEGMGTWNYWLWGLEAAFIYQFYELVFPTSI